MRRRQKDQSQRRRCEDGSRHQRERREDATLLTSKKEEGLQAKESRWHLEAGRSEERILP